MKSRWILVLGVALLCAQPFVAQEDAPTPADETEAARQDDAAEGEAGKKKIQNGLYVEVGVGTASMDPLDTTLRKSSSALALNSIEFEDMDYGRAVIGWRLPGNKGRFRLIWEGFTETGYKFSSTGRLRDLGSTVPVDPVTQQSALIGEGLDWWNIEVIDGAMTVTEAPPVWTFADDADGDNTIERSEVTYPSVTFSNSLNIAADLENRVQIADIVFGREFGPRRFEGVWWGGLRYFAYEGTLLQGAWLHGSRDQYTDGVLLPLIHATQKSSGYGPTGSLGFQVNFFEKRFQLFASGKFAFTMSNIETDTGTFFSLTNGFDNSTTFTAPARLQAERSRTSWHTHVEGGMRLTLKNGLGLEIAYYKGGFLDAVITPTEIRIPQSAGNIPNGTTGFFATQDLKFDGWRSSLSFQF